MGLQLIEEVAGGVMVGVRVMETIRIKVKVDVWEALNPSCQQALGLRLRFGTET